MCTRVSVIRHFPHEHHPSAMLKLRPVTSCYRYHHFLFPDRRVAPKHAHLLTLPLHGLRVLCQGDSDDPCHVALAAIDNAAGVSIVDFTAAVYETVQDVLGVAAVPRQKDSPASDDSVESMGSDSAADLSS